MAAPAHLPRRPASGRQRQCVACRARAPAEAMLGLAAPAGGRRSWACLRRACLGGLARPAGGRGRAARPLWGEGEAGLSALHRLADGRVGNLLGLARRGGDLVWGTEALGRWAAAPGAVVFVGDDAPPRRRRMLPSNSCVWPAVALGRAVGLPSVAAVAIRPGRWARQAAYWLRLWYETAPHASEEAAERAWANGSTDRGAV